MSDVKHIKALARQKRFEAVMEAFGSPEVTEAVDLRDQMALAMVGLANIDQKERAERTLRLNTRTHVSTGRRGFGRANEFRADGYVVVRDVIDPTSGIEVEEFLSNEYVSSGSLRRSWTDEPEKIRRFGSQREAIFAQMEAKNEGQVIRISQLAHRGRPTMEIGRGL